jgi:hypothetical protein
MTSKGIRVSISTNPIDGFHSFHAFSSPDHRVEAEEINLLRESRDDLIKLYAHEPKEFLRNLITSKLLFWKREAELAGCDFSVSNWRSDAFQEKLDQTIELFIQGNASLDEVKLYHDEIIRCKNPRKFVRVGYDLVRTVTPQVDFESKEMEEVCRLLGVNKDEYVLRFL